MMLTQVHDCPQVLHSVSFPLHDRGVVNAVSQPPMAVPVADTSFSLSERAPTPLLLSPGARRHLFLSLRARASSLPRVHARSLALSMLTGRPVLQEAPDKSNLHDQPNHVRGPLLPLPHPGGHR